jgi:hypothetical protein
LTKTPKRRGKKKTKKQKEREEKKPVPKRKENETKKSQMALSRRRLLTHDEFGNIP